MKWDLRGLLRRLRRTETVRIYGDEWRVLNAIRKKKVWIVRLKGDECGMYAVGFYNSFGTSLMARGSRAALDALAARAEEYQGL